MTSLMRLTYLTECFQGAMRKGNLRQETAQKSSKDRRWVTIGRQTQPVHMPRKKRQKNVRRQSLGLPNGS